MFLYIVSLDTVVFAADPDNGAIPQIASEGGVTGGNSTTISWTKDYVPGFVYFILGCVLTAFLGIRKYFQDRREKEVLQDNFDTLQKKFDELDKQFTVNKTLDKTIVDAKVRDVGKLIHQGGSEPYHKKTVVPFEPDFIFAPDVRSIPVAHLVEDILCDLQNKPVPILLGLCFFRKEIQLADIPGGKIYRCLEDGDHEVNKEIRKRFTQIGGFDFIGVTEKWANYVPLYAGISKDSKVLIVDDFCERGSTIRQLKEYFTTKYEIKEANIKATCLITRPDAPYPPDYSMVVDEHVIRLPWGDIK